MAVKFISIKCPECGAKLDVEEGRKEFFCTYCGTKIIMQNDNEYIYRKIDEAKIKRAEADEKVELKKLELLEKQRIADEKAKQIKIFFTVILATIAIVFIWLGDSGNFAFTMPGLVCCYILMAMWLGKNDKEKK